MEKIPCMFDPDEICTKECGLYQINLYGILSGAKSLSEVETTISSLRLQPKTSAIAHRANIERIAPLLSLDCQHTPKH